MRCGARPSSSCRTRRPSAWSRSENEVLDLAKRSEPAISRSGSGPRRIGARAKVQGSGDRPAAARRRRPANGCSSRPSCELAAIYGQISEELSSQYTIGYRRRIRSATGPGGGSSCASPSERDRAHQAGIFAPTTHSIHERRCRWVSTPRALRRLYHVVLPAQPCIGRSARRCSWAAAFAHTFIIGMQTIEAGHIRRSSGRRGDFPRSSGCSGLSYLYVEITTDERAIGVFILPLLVALQAIPALGPRRGARRRCSRAAVRRPCVVAAVRVRELRAGLRASGSPTCCCSRRSRRSTSASSSAAAVVAGARRDEPRAVVVGWVCLTVGLIVGASGRPDARHA